MKPILFFLLLTFAATAKTTTKQFKLGPDGVNYFEITTVTQDDGSYVTTANLVGPANALAADQADKIEQKMLALSQAAYAVSFANRTLTECSNASDTISTLTGLSPLNVIRDRYRNDLTKAGWTIDQGAGFLPIVFTVNAQGALRYSINGAATKSATVFGAVIRLNAYPATGTNTDFFLSENGSRYFSLPNRSNVIKRP